MYIYYPNQTAVDHVLNDDNNQHWWDNVTSVWLLIQRQSRIQYYDTPFFTAPTVNLQNMFQNSLGFGEDYNTNGLFVPSAGRVVICPWLGTSDLVDHYRYRPCVPINSTYGHR